MIDLSKKVDLICVDGRESEQDVYVSTKALMYSCKDIKFNSVQLIATGKPRIFNGSFTKVAPMSLKSYNKFMLNELHRFVKAPYCMLVQWDGFVVYPELWEDEFLNYDFIGAPWPPEWPQCKINRVGNGGFCIRSKKLINICKDIPESKMGNTPEDNLICLNLKDEMVAQGITYAPADVAARFSWENPTPENRFGATFGFHSRHPYSEQYHNLLHD